MTEKPLKGLVYVFTGDGKGKTTAAIGLSIRAVGQDIKVAFIQFIKGMPCGETLYTQRSHPFEIIQLFSGDSFTKPIEQLKEEAQKTLDYVRETILSEKFGLIILDEILVAVSKQLITVQQVLDLLNKKPYSVELVLTGRDAPQEIINRADLVTDMHMIKHPYTEGITGRRGIEF